MTDWIPSQVGLRDHPKTRRLARMLDAEPPHVIGYLHCLWYWALDYAPDGDIEDFEPEDIADAAGWTGDPDIFVESLINCGGKKLGFLARVEGRLVIHDWEDNQGDAFRARVQAAAKKRAQRARSRGHETDDVPNNGDGVPESGDSVPTLRDLARAKDQTRPIKTPMSNGTPSDRWSEAATEVFDHWREVMQHPDAKFKSKSKRYRAVVGRLKDGYTVDQLKRAVDGCRASPHNMGQNETGTVYDDLELICRDDVHVERFIARAKPEMVGCRQVITSEEDWFDGD